MQSWRDMAKPIIVSVIARVGKQDMKALRKELREAYPFGPRENHPYKSWCDEIRRQLGEIVIRDRKSIPKIEKPIVGQLEMFE